MAQFDPQAAAQAGYSPEEIARIQQGIQAARAAGYSDDEIAQHLGSLPPTPTTPPLSAAARWPLGIAASVGRGVENALGLPGDLEVGAYNYLGVPVGWQDQMHQAVGIFPTSSEVRGWTPPLSSPSLAPQSTPERLTQAAAEGIGTALPMLPLGAEALPTLAAGGASGVASEGAHQLWPDSTLFPIAAGIAAGGAVQGARGLLAGNTVENIANQLGQSKTLEDAGKELQTGARNWLTNTMPQHLANLWAPVDQAIPATTEVPLNQTMGVLRGMVGKGGSIQKAVAELSPKLVPRLLDILENKTPVGVGVNPTWQEVRDLRSAIGDAKVNPQTVKDISAQQIDALYAAVTGDLGSAARGVSPQAEQLFNQANQESSRLYQIAEGPVRRIVASDKPSAKDIAPERVANSLLLGTKKGGTNLATIRQILPDETDELAAVGIRQPNLWNQMSPEGKNALVPDQQMRTSLDRAMPQATPKGSPLTAAAESTAGTLLGGAWSGLLAHAGHLGVNPMVAQQFGEAVGGTAPIIYNIGKHLIVNPNQMALPALGGVVGAHRQQ